MVLTAVGLAPLGLEILDWAKADSTRNQAKTHVEILAGGGNKNVAGTIPNVYLWDNAGTKIGQWKSNGRHLDESHSSGDTTGNDISIPHESKKTGQPHYILLNAANDDAICISQVTVTSNGVAWSWLGDIARNCGAEWYHSKTMVGSRTYMPACAWLDEDHSNGGRYRAMSLHMPDFNGATKLT